MSPSQRIDKAEQVARGLEHKQVRRGRIEDGFAAIGRRVHRWLSGLDDEGISLTFRYSGGFCLLVAKRINAEGAPVVCFIEGDGAGDCLMILERKLDDERAWRPDKPFKK